MNKLIVFILAIINVACTGMLWKNNSYTEYVGGFYTEENSNTLVAIGSKFHYIFNVNSDLLEILKASESIPYKANFGSFHVLEDNKIFGRLTLEVGDTVLTRENVVFLKTHGFKQNSGSSLYYHQVIKGYRYAAEKKPFGNIINFENGYAINVTAELSDVEYREKTLLTPVTITTDAILVVPLGLLYGVSFALD